MTVATLATLTFFVASCDSGEEPQAARCDDARSIFDELSSEAAAVTLEFDEVNSGVRFLSPYTPEGRNARDALQRISDAYRELVFRTERLVEQNTDCFTVQERLDITSAADSFRDARTGDS